MNRAEVILSLLAILSGVNCLYLRQYEDSVQDQKHDRLLRSWNNYKRKFHIPEIIHRFAEAEENKQVIFNELEVLFLIPLITDHYRKGRVTESDKKILSEIYGNLWSMIEEEAQRESHTNRNPLLTALFDAIRFLTSKEAHYSSDYKENTVRIIPKPSGRKLNIKKTEADHPSQKLLNMAAVLIRSMDSSQEDDADDQSDRIRNSKFYKAVAPSWGSSISKSASAATKKNFRLKRSAAKPTDLDDMPAERIDALLRTLLNERTIHFPNGQNSEEIDDDDYFDVDGQQIDYVYDDHYEYDENIRPRKSFGNDYDNGSFHELMFLAAKHQLREERKLKGRHGSYY